jgi:hypothetical protein
MTKTPTHQDQVADYMENVAHQYGRPDDLIELADFVRNHNFDGCDTLQEIAALGCGWTDVVFMPMDHARYAIYHYRLNTRGLVDERDERGNLWGATKCEQAHEAFLERLSDTMAEDLCHEIEHGDVKLNTEQLQHILDWYDDESRSAGVTRKRRHLIGLLDRECQEDGSSTW